MSSDDSNKTTRTEFEPKKTGGSTKVPSALPVATAQYDRNYTIAPTVEWRNLFGLDFGDATTRVAGVLRDVPTLAAPGIVPTRIRVTSPALTRQERGLHPDHVDIDSLRTRLHAGTKIELFGAPKSARQLATSFFHEVSFKMREVVPIERPRVVLTVPGFYNNEERQELKYAAEDGGFTVMGLITDYAAPALAFVHRNAGSQQVGNILVLSMGKASATAAVLNAQEGILRTLSFKSEPGPAGEQILSDLQAFLSSKIVAEASDSEDSSTMVERAEALDLLRKESAIGEDSALVSLVATRLSLFKPLISDALKTAKLTLDRIDHVVLSGLLMKSNLVKSVVSEFVPGHKISVLEADRAGCFGAAIYAAKLAGVGKFWTLQDI